VPAGASVLQLQGIDGGTTFSAPSASPVSADQIVRFGAISGPAEPTSVVAFERPASPTAAKTLTWRLTFGAPISAFSVTDLVRSGTAANCVIGSPVGGGASWSITLTGCGQGSVTLGLKARQVHDAVRNWGPATQVDAPTVLIDRAAPIATAP
jgi:hypothetical protein